jgi:hypothetical protein
MASVAEIRKQAQAEAYLRVAPQLSALAGAVTAAKADRNAALHAATGAYRGISGAIHQAGPQQRRVYTEAQRSAHGTDVIARQTLSQLASSPGVDTIKAAYAHEGAVGGQVIAKQMASRLADLSDRRIEAAAGAAFAKQKALSSYAAERSKLNTRGLDIAREQGAAADASFGKLTQAEEDRTLKRDLQSQELRSRSILQGRRLASAENVAEAQIGSREHVAALGRREKSIQGAKNRQNQRSLAQTRAGAKSGAQFKPSKDQIAQTENYYKAINGYITDAKKKIAMRHTAANYDKLGVPRQITNAAADYVTKGHITPKSAQELQAIGVVVPKSHVGVQVRPHTRSPRSR